MRRPSLRSFFFSSFALFVVAATATPAMAKFPPPRKDPGEWTIMFYMDSDNNLELPQLENILSAARAQQAPGVRIIMLVDRSPKSDEAEGYTARDVLNLKNWDGGKIFEVSGGQLTEIENLGPIDMSDPANLVKYVDKVVDIAPAKKYALIFGDHGASWPGFNTSESNSATTMSLPKLSGALKQITEKTGKLELTVFDDCLMSCIENAQAVAPYSKWIDASAECVPGDGCDYESFLNALAKNPSMEGEELGKSLVQTFGDFYLKSSSESHKRAANAITMALIDSSKVDAVAESLKSLEAVLVPDLQANGRETFVKIAEARAKSTQFGRGKTDEESVGVVDIVDFCHLLKKSFGSGEVAAAADDVIAKTESAVVDKVIGKGLARSGGMSVYLPVKPSSLSGEGNTYANTGFDASIGWSKVIEAMVSDDAKDTSDPDLENVAASAPMLYVGQKLDISGATKADDIDDVFFSLALPLGEEHLIIGMLPTDLNDKGEIEEHWDGNWLYVHNGKQAMIATIADYLDEDPDKPDSDVLAVVPLQVKLKGHDNWINVIATFLLDEDANHDLTGEVVYAFREERNQFREIEFDSGDSVRPVLLHVDKDDKETWIPAEDPKLEITVEEEGLKLGESRVPAGEYEVGVRLTDVAGNASHKLVKVNVADTPPPVNGNGKKHSQSSSLRDLQEALSAQLKDKHKRR